MGTVYLINDSETERYLSINPFGSFLGLLHPPIEVNRKHVFRAGLLPWVPVPQPIICLLHLLPCKIQSNGNNHRIKNAVEKQWVGQIIINILSILL